MENASTTTNTTASKNNRNAHLKKNFMPRYPTGSPPAGDKSILPDHRERPKYNSDWMLAIPRNLLEWRLMNIFIENAESLEYLANDSQWTKNITAGKQFGNTRVAYAAAKLEAVHAFNIVSYIPALQTKQIVNLGSRQGARTRPKPAAA